MKLIGPILISICMLLRSTDVFFRKTTLKAIAPLELITIEHLIVFILLIPFLPKLSFFKKLTVKEWISLIFISCGASVGGIFFFTLGFKYTNPAVIIFLQKLQPIVTISLSLIFLKEKISKNFYFWALLAITAGYGLSFQFAPPWQIIRMASFKGTMCALAATFLWGSGTVFGKYLLKNIDNFTVTKIRYFFGCIFALFLFFTLSGFSTPAIINNPNNLYGIIYMALVPGLLALLFFYKGLKNTKASTASILELIFPLSSMIIVWIFLNQPLSPVQLASAFILLISTIKISFIK